VEFTGIFEANTEFSGIFILRIYWLNFSLIEGENCLGRTAVPPPGYMIKYNIFYHNNT
jgi:hypothetical protein